MLWEFVGMPQSSGGPILTKESAWGDSVLIGGIGLAPITLIVLVAKLVSQPKDRPRGFDVVASDSRDHLSRS
jgi:hypothetical protein